MADPWSWFAAAGSAPLRLEQPVSLLRLDGPDTLRFLHGQSSQDLALAPAGAWRRTAFISPTARLIALAEVLVDPAGAWLVITAGDGEAVRQSLDRVLFPADDVRLGPLQAGVWLEPLSQAGSARIEAAAASAAAEPWQGHWQGSAQAGWRLGEAWVLPAGVGPAALEGALAGTTPLPEPLRQWRRLALGLPAAPQEINGDTNPFELGLADRVSLTKGCYVGQETLARLATYDGVKQQLRRWFLPVAAGAPQPGMELRTAGGERAGVITSQLPLADGSGWVGLVLVRRGALESTALEPAGLESAALQPPLQLSRPEAFVPPPVGAGSQARAVPG
jgi:folate-binding protein YgfZ